MAAGSAAIFFSSRMSPAAFTMHTLTVSRDTSRPTKYSIFLSLGCHTECQYSRLGSTARLLHLCRLGLDGEVPDHWTSWPFPRKRFVAQAVRDGGGALHEGRIVAGKAFAVDASIIVADAHRRRGVAKVEDLDPTSKGRSRNICRFWMTRPSAGRRWSSRRRSRRPIRRLSLHRDVLQLHRRLCLFRQRPPSSVRKFGGGGSSSRTWSPRRSLPRLPQTAPPGPPPSAQSASPWRNVQPIDGPYARWIDAAHSGLVSPVLHETARAWKVQREPASPRGCRSRKCSIRARTGGSASSSYCRPRCFVPDFDGAFLSSDSKDALWDRFYTGAPQRRSGCVPRQAFRGRHGV